jgi:3-oxoacid CoA-transferase subunit A
MFSVDLDEYLDYCHPPFEEFDKIYVMGDIHGKTPIVLEELINRPNKDKIAVILLGDAGLNYYGNTRDFYFKKYMNEIGVHFYCLRGNHEKRPEDVAGIERMFDCYTENYVYAEPQFPNIKYLIDGYEYMFNGYSCLAIGGAYSVDKWYRLERNWMWFANEQLNEKEKSAILDKWTNQFVNIILSHTCPFDWQPTDLFIPEVDQIAVDNSMELWLNEVKNKVFWDKWLFGHYHQTRDIIEMRVKMLSNDILLDLEEWYE